MADTLKIDPDAVEAAAESVRSVAEELQEDSLKTTSDTSNELAGIDIGQFAFREGLTAATSFWSRRTAGFGERLVDGAEFMEANAAKAREIDEDSAQDFVELEGALAVGEYRRDDYYEATGAERPAPARPADGGSVPVR
ncbi:hypothetical protein [Salininema proteolyticum]|uniref:Excreted virulence factor EspC (Type VII ESX diderm) n=1 Tax=Salininema proteolyticum TaxID=1607685 RepID=A0ABV8TTU9_9ACTN